MTVPELQGIFSVPNYRAIYAYAKATRTCLGCGNPAKEFRDASAKLEYSVSAFCQCCQDEYFKRGQSLRHVACVPS